MNAKLAKRIRKGARMAGVDVRERAPYVAQKSTIRNRPFMRTVMTAIGFVIQVPAVYQTATYWLPQCGRSYYKTVKKETRRVRLRAA